ncbi:MAG TPA: alpha/beta hydrolase [Bacteroidia bacterium]|nr:alpha/beta hydrolase [Bacteroidia bacterium]
MKIIRRIVVGLVLLYAVVLLVAFIFQEKLLFHPATLAKDFKYELASQGKEVSINTDDGQTISGLLIKRGGSKHVMLYFHGNGGSLDTWQWVANDLKELDCDMLIIDYRGYGKSTGSFSESGFYLDAVASYDYLVAAGYDPDDIIIYGRSLGTGIAIDLATKRKARGLILESPYTSITAVAKVHYPYLLPGLLSRYKFNSLEKAPKLTLPVLIIHGDSDELIPSKEAEELYSAIKSTKTFTLIKGGDHNNLIHFPEHNRAIADFLNRL